MKLLLKNVPPSLSAQRDTLARPSATATVRVRSGWLAALALMGLVSMGQGAVEPDPIFRLEASRAASNAVDLRAAAPSGRIVTLEASSDLVTWNWHDFALAADNGASFGDITPNAPARFFRGRADAVASVEITNYRGWSNSVIVRNGRAEIVIVPAIGRIMQFRFAGENDGPFWENPAMYGQRPSSSQWNTPGAFGGDKVWPSPQSLWNWPPPTGFDAAVYTATVTNGAVLLTGPLDAAYGTRVVRWIELHPTEPVMRVTSVFQKEQRTNQIGVWVVAQLKDPVRMFMPVPSPTIFTNRGYVPLGSVPRGLIVTNQLVSFARDPSSGTKVGNDSGALLWVGTNSMLLMESPRVLGVPRTGYPDQGCSAEIYTNPNPTPYIELELLGPLQRLTPGNRLEQVCTYTLLRRSAATPEEEARRLLLR